MARFVQAIIQEQRSFGRICRLILHAPELTAGVRAGHYLLVRCADPVSADPLLRRASFVAGVEPDAGTLTLLYAPQERGMVWLARQPAGTPLDLFGPLGTPFTLDNRTRNLLLIGVGAGLGALFLLAQAALRQNAAVVLLTAAPAADLLPPPFLLPPAVEYRGSDAGESSIANLLYGETPPENQATATSELIAWADQIGATLPPALLPTLVSAVRATRLRWQRGFAQVALPGAMPCGTGACLACLIETRHGLRTRCKDGPVFDLRDLPAGGR
ncbi:MAG: hypothetical protein ACLFVO_14010 [Chloroflexaceae bacterium]